MRRIDELIIHCSATDAGRHFTAKDIDRWHRARGFDGIGYHYVTLISGLVEAGRPLKKIGAHAKGRNRHSIGLCYIGGIEDRGRPKGPNAKQAESLRKQCEFLLLRFPNAKIIGHRDTGARKACPSFEVSHWWKTGEIVP